MGSAKTMTSPRTMFDKIWDRHVIHETDDGQTLLYIDRQLLTDGAFHGFNIMAASGSAVRRPDQNFAVPDHYVPTRNRAAGGFADDERRELVTRLATNARNHGIAHFGLGDARQGIVHVIGPEQGITQPGLVMVCGDSHTSTHGALGAFAFGVGASEVGHVLATQSLWQKKPKRMRVSVEGERGVGVTAKDVILAIIAHIGAGGGVGHVIEYAGSVIRGLSAEERMTVCNMSIEAGARAGMIAPDETTYDYLKGRPYAPSGAEWDKALAYWRTLPSDADAAFDRDVTISGEEIAPMVTWGTSPEDAVPITARVPDPADVADDQKRASMRAALDYMGLEPGTALDGLAVDRVFIGSCTNSRIEDLRAAAAVARGRRAAVPTMVVPGSGLIKAAAEAEGLDRIFRDAGFEWLDAGCSMCVGINGDTGTAGQRVASTTNRNFVGRQGTGVRTHLVSPAMAALAAVAGKLTDPRKSLGEGSPS
jgi:3-isopropylmalate/(R)-2-methylmalate dehydratase large subunit